MSDRTCAELFPLPLTAFERYMLDDDRADYPMAFPTQFEFSGDIRRSALEAAIEETLPRHPLLCARVEYLKHRGPCFVHAAGQMPPLDWDVEGVPLRFPNGEAIDLTREVGLRFWVRKGDGTAVLTAQFHHACCDGIGTMRFLGDLFAAYAMRTGAEGAGPIIKPLDVEQLRTRGEFHIEYPEPVSQTKAIWSTVCETAKWAVRRPTPLAVPTQLGNERTGEIGNGGYPGIEVHRFDMHQSRLLRQTATRLGATLNDLLLRDLFQTMWEWNEQYGPGRMGKWMQINMPQNLRTHARDGMPAANKMSYVFLTRRTSGLRDAQALLDGIRWETKIIKDWSLGLYFIVGLSCVQKVPGLYRWIAGRNRCFATTVLSNLGDLNRRLVVAFPRDGGRSVVGNLRLENCRMVPPLRSMTHAALLATMYANCLHINVRCDPHRFPPGASRELLSRYIQKIEQTMGQTA